MTATAVPATASRSEHVRIRALGRELSIEYQWIAAADAAAPLLVFLHEGLGSVSMWKDFPARACAALGCRGLVFSRYGYGSSTPRPEAERWPVSYMHAQAEEVLPALFAALGLADEKPILFGHSDGGSIALLYAAMYPDAPRAIVVAAPHIFVEDISVSSIEQARQAYLNTDLPAKLGRYHQVPDSAFWGWNHIWLDPAFRAWNIEAYLDKIRCPILAVQGEDDEYGTLEQIRGIQRLAPQARLSILPDCRHSPHKDQPEKLIAAMREFVGGLGG
ncbi:alpha/beta fold hydrolase [Candidimonas nitroreducens]|uniref:Alpha/beta hydrolase n=1 Tax=Candidimonas nitroreducens TaxID=683354 RepID=A0A225MKQ0_9BURK|nr:alpha/beta hydrolase [Candidimonas nitroreducens]OWT61824.1 alpha/beta hydrolase [Candidimonas nitroreducens]